MWISGPTADGHPTFHRDIWIRSIGEIQIPVRNRKQAIHIEVAVKDHIIVCRSLAVTYNQMVKRLAQCGDRLIGRTAVKGNRTAVMRKRSRVRPVTAHR